MKIALPTKNKVLKWTLGVIGTILLGALGSGVWQSLLGPALHLSTRWILDLASLGLSSYKNGVYEQVAADNQSRAAIETLYVVTLVYFIIFLVIMQYLFGRLANLRNRSQRLFGGLSSASEPAPTPDGMRKELETILKSLRRMRLVLYFYAMFMGVVFVNHFVAQARLSYISSADAHYHQVMREAAPYLDAREQAGVESEFAQIGSREDYVRLLSRLEGQCKAHGKTVPKFDPW